MIKFLILKEESIYNVINTTAMFEYFNWNFFF